MNKMNRNLKKWLILMMAGTMITTNMMPFTAEEQTQIESAEDKAAEENAAAAAQAEAAAQAAEAEKAAAEEAARAAAEAEKAAAEEAARAAAEAEKAAAEEAARAAAEAEKAAAEEAARAAAEAEAAAQAAAAQAQAKAQAEAAAQAATEEAPAAETSAASTDEAPSAEKPAAEEATAPTEPAPAAETPATEAAASDEKAAEKENKSDTKGSKNKKKGKDQKEEIIRFAGTVQAELADMTKNEFFFGEKIVLTAKVEQTSDLDYTIRWEARKNAQEGWTTVWNGPDFEVTLDQENALLEYRAVLMFTNGAPEVESQIYHLPEVKERPSEEKIEETDPNTDVKEEPAEKEKPEESGSHVEKEKKVTIFTSGGNGTRPGDQVVLSSMLEGFDDCEEIIFQWMVNKGEGFEEIEGANQDTYRFTADEENLKWGWKLNVDFK